MAYASTSSPFASVKGQNVFGKPSSFSKGPSPSPSPSPLSSQISRFQTAPALGSPLGDPSSLAPTATKRTGFEAFSGSASPFASASRSKSPNRSLSSNVLRSKSPGGRSAAGKSTSAFTTYAIGGAHSFAVPMSKRARAGTPDGESPPSRGSLERNSTLSMLRNEKDREEDIRRRRDDGQLSFGEKLRAGKDAEEETSDEDTKPELTAQAGMSSISCLPDYCN
jgi:Ran-binding protein 3